MSDHKAQVGSATRAVDHGEDFRCLRSYLKTTARLQRSEHCSVRIAEEAKPRGGWAVLEVEYVWYKEIWSFVNSREAFYHSFDVSSAFTLWAYASRGRWCRQNLRYPTGALGQLFCTLRLADRRCSVAPIRGANHRAILLLLLLYYLYFVIYDMLEEGFDRARLTCWIR